MSEGNVRLQEHAKETAICTLFEGDYHLGLAAFVNSLARAGYKGTVWAGYRGALPPWIGQLERIGNHDAEEFRVTDDVRLALLKLSTAIHLTNYKPEFMLNLLANQAGDCDYLWYFDPDIFVLANWSYFHKWQSCGVALCQEVVDNIFPEDAPLRKEWMNLAEAAGFANPRPVNHYYNAGMVGVPRAQQEFLEEWRRLIKLAESLGYDLKYLAHGTREMPFNISDQDALNIAIMYTRSPLSTLGPQGMGFILGASMVMYHTVGQKPWRGSFVLRALRGMPPSGAMKFFLARVDSPIRAYSPMYLWWKRLGCSIATLIGRFYRRS